MKQANVFSTFLDYRVELMGLATIWIALMHFFVDPLPTLHIPVLTPILARGNLGVEMFLLLSGMGLYYSLKKDRNARHFYQRRIKRVVIPWLLLSLPYWIAATAIGISSTVSGDAHAFSPGLFLLNWSGLSFWLRGTTTVWYVSFILLMYLLYPAIFDIQTSAQGARKILALIALDVVCNIVVAVAFPGLYDSLEIALTRVPCFLAGSLIGETVFHRQRPSLSLKVLLMISGLLFLSCYPVYTLDKRVSVMLYRYGGAGVMALFMLLLCALFEKADLPHLRKILRFFGKISLEFYLVSVFLRNLVVYLLTAS